MPDSSTRRTQPTANDLTRALVFGAVLLTVAHTAVARPFGPAQPAQVAAPAARDVTSRVTVMVPAEDAELVVEGEAIPGEGTSRQFVTPPLEAGGHTHTFTVSWKPNTYTTMTRSKSVSFRAGESVSVDLTADDPSDRVRVIYVPTPADVAEAMVDLAGVTRSDVVFEPGCGDARVTIAAIRQGARRGICVDIDEERARESRANVQAAGMANRIDVRHGDALEVEDLSDVTVVFLYMGDHFNLLIRPILWRDLKVGSRVVSHRFTMGDWKPDKTISTSSDDGGYYDLHVWTVTEEVKRRLRPR